MHIDLIKIGNSRGIRLPQNIIKECGFTNTVIAEVINHSLVLKSPESARTNWKNLFEPDIGKEEEDKELLFLTNDWDEEEWVW